MLHPGSGEPESADGPFASGPRSFSSRSLGALHCRLKQAAELATPGCLHEIPSQHPAAFPGGHRASRQTGSHLPWPTSASRRQPSGEPLPAGLFQHLYTTEQLLHLDLSPRRLWWQAPTAEEWPPCQTSSPTLTPPPSVHAPQTWSARGRQEILSPRQHFQRPWPPNSGTGALLRRLHQPHRSSVPRAWPPRAE